MTHHYAVIMAGGSGTRLWPLSRRNRPKQVLKLFDKSLIRIAVDWLSTASLFKPEEIHIVAIDEHRDALLAEVPELPTQNFIGEPMARDTAAAVGLAAVTIHQRDPDSIMSIFTADHLMANHDPFRFAV